MASVRDALFTSGNGQVMYLPEHDIRKDLGFPTNSPPPQTTTNKFAFKKVVWVDHERRVIYHYDANGQLDEKPFQGAHKATDQEVRAVLETRLPRAEKIKTGKFGPLTAKDSNGVVVATFDHKNDGNPEYDFREGAKNPKADDVGDLAPSLPEDKVDEDGTHYDDMYDPDNLGGTPVFCYATNPKLRAYADAWVSEIDRGFDPNVETKLTQVDFFTGRMWNCKCYIAIKAAQQEGKNYPAFVKEFKKKADAFNNAKVTDAPRVPHISWKFFPHQARVLAMLDKNEHAMVGVAAGGGKTLIAAADILNYVNTKRAKRGCIVMPGDGLVAQQKQEIKEFTNGTVNVICLTSAVVSQYCSKTEDGRYDLEPLRKMIVKAPPNTIILATYSFFTQDKIKTATKDKFRFPRAYWLAVKCGVDMVNIDECHKIKNDSDTSNAMLQLGEKVTTRRAMSGTLVANNLKDIHRPGVFVDASVLGDLDTFLERYAEVYDVKGETASVKKWKAGAAKAIRARLMGTCGVQLSRSHWMYMLPKFNKRYHKVEMSAAQNAAYQRIVNDTMRELEEGVEILRDSEGNEIGTKPNPTLAKLWKEYQDMKPEDKDGDEEVNPMLLAKLSKFDQYVGCPLVDSFTRRKLPKADRISPKVKKLDEILDEHFKMIPAIKKAVEAAGKKWDANMGKVIVFSTFQDVAYHLQQQSKYRTASVYYDAGHKAALQEFKTNPKIKVVFAVEQSMREGHNLQMASRIIRVNVPWNPGDIEQTKARTYRAGNSHPEVYEDVIICDGSAEVAKGARLIMKMHNNAKLLSDFDDDNHLEPIFMNKDTLRGFTNFDKQLNKYLPLEASIQKYDEDEADRLMKVNGKIKLKLGNGKTLSGSKTIVTPYVKGDPEHSSAPKEKPSKTSAADRGTAPHGAITKVDMLIRQYETGSNNVIVRADNPNHPKLKRLGGDYEENIYVFRCETAEEAAWLMQAMPSVGVGVHPISGTKTWAQWAAKSLPKGKKITAKLPGKEKVDAKKPKNGWVDIYQTGLNKRSYFYIWVSELTPTIKAAIKKIQLNGNSWKLLVNAGYHFAEINTKKKLFDLLRSFKAEGYAAENSKEFETMVDKFFPGQGGAALSIVSVEAEATDEDEQGSEEESEAPKKKPKKTVKKASSWRLL